MRRTGFALAALSTALVSSPALAEPLALKPSSPWNVDFGEEKCRLTRFFGEEGNKHVLIFEQFWPESSLGMTAAGASFKRFRSGRLTNVSFFGKDSKSETYPFAGQLGDYGDALVFSRISVKKAAEQGNGAFTPPVNWRQLDAATAREVKTLSVTQSDKEVAFATGPLDEAFSVLNLCTRDLVASWGLDAEKQMTVSQPVVWTNAVAISRKIQERYPPQAAKEGEQAILRMRVIVNEKGEMEQCNIIDVTVTDKLDSPACKEMRGARFKPSLDANGEPMRSYYATSITYQLN